MTQFRLIPNTPHNRKSSLVGVLFPVGVSLPPSRWPTINISSLPFHISSRHIFPGFSLVILSIPASVHFSVLFRGVRHSASYSCLLHSSAYFLIGGPLSAFSLAGSFVLQFCSSHLFYILYFIRRHRIFIPSSGGPLQKKTKKKTILWGLLAGVYLF
jgi:hypothetical protein